jgi:hypothetical protein
MILRWFIEFLFAIHVQSFFIFARLYLRRSAHQTLIQPHECSWIAFDFNVGLSRVGGLVPACGLRRKNAERFHPTRTGIVRRMTDKSKDQLQA